jgi:hypothetical protein
VSAGLKLEHHTDQNLSSSHQRAFIFETLSRDPSCDPLTARIVGYLADVSLDLERRHDGGERVAAERRP